MGFITAYDSAFGTITLEHNDTVIDTYEDEWGVHDVYLVETVHWEEKEGSTWNVTIAHPSTGLPVEQVITPFETGSINLPTPARFNSYPLDIGLGLVRA